MKEKTQTGERPDLLEHIGVQEGLKRFTFPHILPFVPVTEKAGNIDVSVAPDLTIAAQVDRDVTKAGGPTSTSVATATRAYACKPVQHRADVPYLKTGGYGGIEGADFAGAKQAGLVVLKKLEQQAVAKFFTTAAMGAADVLERGRVIEGLQKAADTTLDYGSPALWMTRNTYRMLVGIPEVIARLKAAGIASGNISFITAQKEEVRQAVAGLFGFFDILLGEDALWGAAYLGFIGIAAIRPEYNNAPVPGMKLEPSIGATMVALPYDDLDETKPIRLTSHPDDTDEKNYYTATAEVDQLIANAAAFAVVQLDTDPAAYAGIDVNVLNPAT